MATKEDILEQIVEEYLIHLGYFVQHNVKFRPRTNHPDFASNQDSNHSDIDVLGYHPLKTGPDRVLAVSCKSWQAGFSPAREIDAITNDKVLSGRKRWKTYRELCSPKWSEAFLETVRTATASETFTHVIAVSHLKGDATIWTDHSHFRNAINGNPLQILTFGEMVESISGGLTQTLAGSEVGRLLQMFKAAKII